mgnify:CR=1 FL=1
MQHRRHKSITERLFSGGWWALFTMFVWELVEEGVETLIAFCVSEVVAMFVVKALSTLAIIGATQGIKVCIKRFLVPVIKTLTYKEGFDKMSKIKQFFPNFPAIPAAVKVAPNTITSYIYIPHSNVNFKHPFFLT